MSLLHESQIESSVYLCTFQCTVREATISMKFPCSYFVEWSTSNGKSMAITSRYKPQQNHVNFNQTLKLTTEMIYNHQNSQYTKKETLIQLFLVSKSRPDQNKLVGRVTIDLAKVSNFDMYARPTQFKLNFCSVQGNLILQFTVVDQKLTTKRVQDLDRSSFIDYISQIALKGSKGPTFQKQKQSFNQAPLSVLSGVEENQAKISIMNGLQILTPGSINQNIESFSHQEIINAGLKMSDPPKQEKIINKRVVTEKIVSQQIQKEELNNFRNRVTFGDKNQCFQENIQLPQKEIIAQIQNGVQQYIIPTINIVEVQSQPDNYSQAQVVDFRANQVQEQPIIDIHEVISTMKVSLRENQYPAREDIMKIGHEAINENQTSLNLQLLETQRKLIQSAHQTQIFKEHLQLKQQQIQKLTQNIQNSESIMLKYQLQIQNLNQENLQQKQSINSKQQLINQLKYELSDRQSKFHQLQQSLNQVQEKHIQLIQNSSHNKYDNTYFEQRVTTYQEEIGQLNKLLVQFQNKQFMSQQKVAGFEQVIKSLEAKNQYLQLKVNQLEGSKAPMLQEIDDLEKMIESVRVQKNEKMIQSIKSQKKEQMLQSIRVQNNKKMLQSIRVQKKDNLSQQTVKSSVLVRRQMMQEVDGLRQENSNLEINIQQLKGQNNQLNIAKQMMFEQLEEKKLQLDQLKSKNDVDLFDLKTKLDQLVIEVEEEKAKNGILDFQLKAGKESQNQVILMGEEMEKLNGQIQFLKESMKLLQSSSVEDNQLHKIKEQSWQGQIKQLEQQNSQLKRLNSNFDKTNIEKIELLNKIAIFEQGGDKYRQQLDRLMIKIQQTKQMLMIERNKNNEMINQKQQLNAKLRTYQRQIEDYQQQNKLMKSRMQQISLISHQSSPKYEDNWQDRCQEYQLRVSKLNYNLEEQINQNNQLSQTILQYMEKQAKMKQTLTVLEQESRQLFGMFQEKEHNQQTYQKMISDLQREMDRMRDNIFEIHNKEPIPIKTVLSSPRINISRDERDQTIRHLEQLNHDRQLQIQHLRINYKQASIDYQAQVQKLTQEVVAITNTHKRQSLSPQRAQYQKDIANKQMEIEIWKSRNRQNQEVKFNLQRQLQKIGLQMELIEQQKFGFQSTINEKDIKIMELQQQKADLVSYLQTRQSQTSNHNGKPTNKINISDLASSFSELKQHMVSRTSNADWDILMKNVLDRSLCGQEQSKLISMQQQSRLLSKQMQKLKAQLLKSSSKNQQQRLTFMSMIKKCQIIIIQLISLAESLNLNQSSFL